MRSRMAFLVFATTSIVVVAFLAPLVVLVREIAVERAMAAGAHDAQSVASSVGLTDRAQLAEVVEGYNHDQRRTSVLFVDGTMIGPALAASDSLTIARSGEALTAVTAGGQEILIPVETPSGLAVVRTLVPNALLGQGVPEAIAVLTALGCGLVVLAVVVADRLARRVLRPVAALATTARRLAHGDLTARVRPAGPPEIDDVCSAMNMLARRIGELVEREREAVADLSHRLRTPLTALRLEAHALADPRESATMIKLVGALERTTTAIIKDARRPARQDGRSACDAVLVVARRAAFWAPLAEDQGRRVVLRLPDEPLLVHLAAEDLAALVDALLENVLAHTPEGVDFTVAVWPRSGGGACLAVADAGPGLPSGSVARRGASRAGSTGLGLDIVRRTAESSGGRLLLGASAVGGAQVEVELGAAPAERQPAHRQQVSVLRRRPAMDAR